MVSDSEKADYEADTFEDAQSSHDSEIPASQGGTRSLTDRRPSSSGSPLATPKATEHPQSSPDSPERNKSDDDDDDGEDGDRSDDDKDKEELSSPVSQPEEETPRKPKKSPLLTAHRLSTTSMDEVNLAGPKEDEEDASPKEKPATSPDSQHEGPPALPPRDDSPKQTSRLQGLSASLPSVPWGPPPVNKNLPPNPPQSSATPPRKLTSPFTWLSRASTGAREKVSPGPPTNRRNTAASVSTLGSNPELAGRFHDDGDTGSLDSRKQLRNSLKDQFKLLRMRDEGVSAVSDDQASVASGPEGSRTSGVISPTSIAEEQEGNDAAAPLPSPAATSPLPSTVNPNLAPGTVAGISSSATDASAPVDWELWQQLVNQGPEALSGPNIELNAAIKRGIPQTIRGVIWQILADSRNLDLEEVYKELSARGTEKDRDRYWSMSSAVTVNGHANGSPGEKEKESLTSSRSSIRSETSTAATSSNHGIISPSSSSDNKDPEAVTKAQAALEGIRKKKAKEDAIALQKLEKAIRRDLGSRTSYSKYFLSQRNQEALFGLCKAYALYDEGVGYAQGMNFIVMPLLFNLDEGEAFTLLVKLMNKYGLRNMFIQDMPGLHLHLYQFDRLLEDLEPALACHLRRRGVPPQLYATQWFLTLFAYRFPLQLVLRIYDLIFEEGVESTILRFAVSIMLRNAETLLGMNDMTTLTTFLKEKIFDVYIDNQPSANSILESGFFGSSGPSDKEVYRADLMVQDACAIKLTPEMIKTYTTEWEEKTRVEKEQAAELESLKHTVSAQSARIRSLEEHAEKSDTEHVQLASELVRLKVENEELKDMNESYKVQVQELKGVIDRQPAEVEEKLRTEMDRIMKRNIEVQNENRAMEEQTAEMEKDLVETKMKWAELCENHENLKQKWSDLRRALD